MRFSTNQTAFDTNPALTWNMGRTNLITTFYRGQTTDATATELFIDGITGRRMVPDRAGCGVIRLLAACYNTTGAGVPLAYTDLRIGFFVSSAGVITMLDQDTGTAGTQDNVPVALQGLVTRGGNLGTSVAADYSVQMDAVASSGTPGQPGFVPAYLRVRVRGTAATTVTWEVFAEVLEVTATNS